MEETKRIYNIRDYTTWKDLRDGESEIMHEIFYSDEYNYEDTAINYILFLHRRIRDTLKIITVAREMRKKATPQEKLQVLDKNCSPSKKELTLNKQEETNSQ